jgi:diacylglycerol kinase family enzyme
MCLRSGQHVYSNKMKYFKAKKYRVEFKGKFEFQIDGDLFTGVDFIELACKPAMFDYLM